MLIQSSCEGVSLLRKITITIDDGTLECLRVMRAINGIPYSAAIRRAVWAYYQDVFSVPSDRKKQASVGSSGAEVDYYAV